MLFNPYYGKKNLFGKVVGQIAESTSFQWSVERARRKVAEKKVEPMIDLIGGYQAIHTGFQPQGILEEDHRPVPSKDTWIHGGNQRTVEAEVEKERP